MMVYFNIWFFDAEGVEDRFGCMSLPADERSAILSLHKAMDLGVNYLDTADIYNDGINEMIIGKAIKGKRHSIVLASKAGNVRRPDGNLDWNPTKNIYYAVLMAALRGCRLSYRSVPASWRNYPG
jgi:aryl-alcohol dehydrogenase-like predicted oxidoreductase